MEKGEEAKIEVRDGLGEASKESTIERIAEFARHRLPYRGTFHGRGPAEACRAEKQGAAEVASPG